MQTLGSLPLRRVALITALGSLFALSGCNDSTSDESGSIQISKYQLDAQPDQYIRYEGSNPDVKQDFPAGFFPATGSALAFKGVAEDGSLEFYGLTDRGPNGDGPVAPTAADPSKNGASKVFPVPSFRPAIGLISVSGGKASLKSLMTLSSGGMPVSGRPLASGVGSSGETPLTEALKYQPEILDFDANGLDPEGLVYDAAGRVFWISDEYGPFLAKIDAATGAIQQKLAPGSGLPAVLALRRANRGMEGLAMDSSGKLHGVLQSPIDPIVSGKSREAVDKYDLDKDGKTDDKVKLKDFAQFVRWMEYDPATQLSRMYAYPVDGSLYGKNRTGNAKLGDVLALGNGKFIVIEQGAGADGTVRHDLMLVEIPVGASNIADIGAELEANSIDGATASSIAWSAVVKLKKTRLLELNGEGWVSEKAEGLTMIDAYTLALINDNDFGLRTVLLDAAGKFVDGSIEDCTVDANGAIISGCPDGVVGARVTKGVSSEQPTHLWLIRFPKKLAEYSIP